jgi:hypothetical protein
VQIVNKGMVLVAEAMGCNGTVDCLLRTVRPPNAFEREMLAASGCILLSRSAGTTVWLRCRGRDANLIANLGFVERIEVVGMGCGEGCCRRATTFR